MFQQVLSLGRRKINMDSLFIAETTFVSKSLLERLQALQERMHTSLPVPPCPDVEELMREPEEVRVQRIMRSKEIQALYRDAETLCLCSLPPSVRQLWDQIGKDFFCLMSGRCPGEPLGSTMEEKKEISNQTPEKLDLSDKELQVIFDKMFVQGEVLMPSTMVEFIQESAEYSSFNCHPALQERIEEFFDDNYNG
jgi:hypothetical protein